MDDLTVIYVAYGVTTLDLDWIPAGVPILVVHNDNQLGPLDRGEVVDLRPGQNLGFGAGVNLALKEVTTGRVLLCNPDTGLQRHHFEALAATPDRDLATLPLVEADGRPNSVVNRYYAPLPFLATAWRLGRLTPRGSRRRHFLVRALGRWGRDHQASFHLAAGSWPVSQWWASAAVLAAPVGALRAVGGFDDAFFLYYEDVDLQQRLAQRFPAMRIVVPDVPPGIHDVGGCAPGASPVGGAPPDPAGSQGDQGQAPESGVVAAHRQRSAVTYARRQPGPAWAVAARLVELTPLCFLP